MSNGLTFGVRTREHFLLNMVPVVWEVVSHDANGLNIAQNTIRMKVADGPWVYGAEFMLPELYAMAKECSVPVRVNLVLRGQAG